MEPTADVRLTDKFYVRELRQWRFEDCAGEKIDRMPGDEWFHTVRNEFLVSWHDGGSDWVPFSEVFDKVPFFVTLFAVAHRLLRHPVFYKHCKPYFQLLVPDIVRNCDKYGYKKDVEIDYEKDLHNHYWRRIPGVHPDIAWLYVDWYSVDNILPSARPTSGPHCYRAPPLEEEKVEEQPYYDEPSSEDEGKGDERKRKALP